MAEEIIEEEEQEVENQRKKKSKLDSMKKKIAISEAPYPFKNEAERIAYKKKVESIVKPGYGEMGYKLRP